MAFIEDLDKRVKSNMAVTIGAIIGSLVFALVVYVWALNYSARERQQIYVLNGEIPLTAERTEASLTEEMEARAHVAKFHSLFFTLAPDNEYIEYNLEKAMYLIDSSGLAQRNTLQEQGFYSQVISASATVVIMTDSIVMDPSLSFTYYGRMRIERKTSIIYRELVTAGDIIKTARTVNNPHGMTITNYRTIRNRDLEYKQKTAF